MSLRHCAPRLAGLALLTPLLTAPLAAEIEFSAAPERVTDIVTSPSASYAPYVYQGIRGVAVDGLVFYVAEDETHGVELWKTDGTEAGTGVVKDIWPGSWPSHPRSLANVAGMLYFQAEDGTHGVEMWKSDGTPEGTVMVADIAPGASSSNPEGFTLVGGTVFFAAYDLAHGDELWKTDGTAAGTALVKDITPGWIGSPPRYLTAADGLLFFIAFTSTYGDEVWRSDGTAAGTFMLKDIDPGPSPSDSDGLTALGGNLYWSAWDGAGEGLWTSDGTRPGTKLVKRMSVDELFATGGMLYLSADGLDGEGWELWKSDGSAAGTVRVSDISPGDGLSGVWNLTVMNGTLYFGAVDGAMNLGLWKSDGTGSGTARVKDMCTLTDWYCPYALIPAGDTLFFLADDGTTGWELWKSDGTEAGTVITADIRPGSESSEPLPLAPLGGSLILVADDGASGREVWASDGTPAGTQMAVDHESSSSLPFHMTNVGGTLFFTADDFAHGRELWTSDGTEAGTTLVKDIVPGAESSSVRAPTPAGGLLYFSATDGVDGYHIWRSDGTEAGTFTVTDALPAEDRAGLGDLVALNGALFFADGRNGLWRTDGTVAGTTRLKEFACSPENYYGVRRQGPAVVGSLVYFRGCDLAHGVELWKSDGTEAGTVLLRDIRPGAASSEPSYLVNVGGTLFFNARTAAYGSELWRSDGTAAGTVLVKDIGAGWQSGFPRSLTDVDGTLFFVASPGGTDQLWRSNGTAAGTAVLTDLPPAPYYCDCDELPLAALNGRALFAKDDRIHGRELWTSDGTPAGTTLLADLAPGELGSYPSLLTRAGGLVFFAAVGEGSGTELWVTDGTAEGTVQVADINPGEDSALIAYSPILWKVWPQLPALTVAGPRLFFPANDGTTGYELWSLDVASPGIASQSVGELGPTWATLHATVEPNGLASTAYFEYGTTTDYGSTTPVENLGASTSPVELSAGLIDLACDTAYHFRAVATNGTWTLRGLDQVFRTVACSIFQLGAAAYSVGEAGPRATVTVTRTGGLAAGVTVDYATSDGSASAGPDYTAVAGTLTFAAGETAKAFTIPIVNDTLDEENEAVGLALLNPGSGGLLGVRSTVVLTILDNDAAGVVQFGTASYAASEGAGEVTIAVTRSSGVASDVTVEYAAGGGTARAGDDYAATSGVLSFGAGETSKTFSVTINDDGLGENDETLGLALSAPTGRATLGARATAVLTIRENERVVQFASAAYLASEAAPRAVVTVRRSGLMTGVATVSCATMDGTAAAASDYTARSGVLTFASGVAIQTVTVPILNDKIDEADETALLQLSAPGNAVLGARDTAVLTLRDDDAGGRLQFRTAALRISEAAIGTVTVTRAGGLASGVTVHYGTSGGTATSGDDYAAVDGTLSFGAGETVKSFTVQTRDDDLSEGEETLILALDGATGGASMGVPVTTTLTIVDRDAYVAFGSAAYSAVEGGRTVITIRRANSSAGGVTVSYSAEAGTATEEDFTAVSGTLTFGAGVSAVAFVVPTIEDATSEPPETVSLSITGASIPVGTPSSATLTIGDDDSGGTIAFVKAIQTVGEKAASVALAVQRTGSALGGTTIHYQTTSSGTATAGEDFVSVEGVLTFAAGQNLRTIAVPLLPDAATEGDETISVTLDSPTPAPGTTLGPTSTMLVSIVDDETLGTFQLAAPAFSVAEPDGEAVITVTRLGDGASSATVQYASSGGTAQAPGDYAAVGGTLSFGPGETQTTFAVPIVKDALPEAGESLALTLSSPVGARLGSPTTATLWILDDPGTD